jgi:hypothetical protein
VATGLSSLPGGIETDLCIQFGILLLFPFLNAAVGEIARHPPPLPESHPQEEVHERLSDLSADFAAVNGDSHTVSAAEPAHEHVETEPVTEQPERSVATL